MSKFGSVPQRGEVHWLDFDPQKEREQAGRRPGLVLTTSDYNAKSSLFLVSPITNKSKNYPFEVALPDDLIVTGVVLADQMKSLDWRARHAEPFCVVPEEVVLEVLEKTNLLLSPE